MIDERAKMIVAKNATAIPKTLLAIALVELLDGSSIANTMSEAGGTYQRAQELHELRDQLLNGL